SRWLPDGRHTGFIAQEVEQSLPGYGLVSEDPEGFKVMAYSRVVPILAEA
ncbi:unnamed protein product, partial [Discosporangium mesarthrocarpum]